MAVDYGTLANVASVTAAFGAAMLFFRIQRELHMNEKKETVWLPLADWLLVAATLICLLGVIVPIAFNLRVTIAAACAVASVILVAGYILGIMAHYRILFGQMRKGPRINPEPAERVVVWLTTVVALAVFAWRFTLWPN
jgi:glucan phosphoethanolaminetransferase (alkaline phosphatase superfamily)